MYIERIDLKDLVGYLPYDLKGYVEHTEELCTLKIKTGTNLRCDINDFINGTYQCKPILRPLSDLIKEIDINGDKFIPIEFFEIGDEINNDFPFEFDSGNIMLISSLETISAYNVYNDINYLPNAVVQKLYEWHFDIHGLIEKGLAIDINLFKTMSYDTNS